MTLTVADIAKKAFDGAAAKISGVIKNAQLKRAKPTGYDLDSGEVQNANLATPCRVLFARADAAAKYFPDLTITPPDELVYIEGAQGLPPVANDVLAITGGANWLLSCPPRDIAQGGGLWVCKVSPQ